MQLEVFEMERMQSLFEHHVDLNLSESGVEPLRLEELLALGRSEHLAALMAQPLAYTQTNGTVELRSRIAALYPDATPDHVEVTSGGAEANLLSLTHLVQPGDEVVLMLPNYMQAWGLVGGLGGVVREWWLRERTVDGRPRWRPDLAELEHLVTPRTRLVAICAPNNPTGARLDDADFDAVCRVAARHGAWVLSDEIYRGAELDGRESPSAWGRYERTIVTSGLSKAYGLPGLRIGWAIGPAETVAALWSIHDYTTIAPAALSDRLARLALEPDVRARLLARTRAIVSDQFAIVRAWADAHRDLVSIVPPEAAAIALLKYAVPIASAALAERLRLEKSTLVVPGDQFRMEGCLRIGFGSLHHPLQRGLDRVAEMLTQLASEPAR